MTGHEEQSESMSDPQSTYRRLPASPRRRGPRSERWKSVTLLSSLLSLSTVGCSTPPGRFGAVPECSPVYAEDPFVHDRCVPPKGVSYGNFGYVRPMWGVLDGPPATCCGPGGMPFIAQDSMMEVLPGTGDHPPPMNDREPGADREPSETQPDARESLEPDAEKRLEPLLPPATRPPTTQNPFGAVNRGDIREIAQVSGQRAVPTDGNPTPVDDRPLRYRLNQLVDIEIEEFGRRRE